MTIVQEPLRALSLVCSLKRTGEHSSTEMLTNQLAEVLGHDGVHCESIRCVDYDIHPGVGQDMGNGDQWPQLRDKVLGADILVLGTPTWLGHMSSVAQRVLERLDAELSETDEEGRPIISGKVAVAAVVGNEDGAHKITADLFQALNDIGFSVPARAAPIGMARPCTKRIIASWTACRRPWRRRRPPRHTTPHILRNYCVNTAIPQLNRRNHARRWNRPR